MNNAVRLTIVRLGSASLDAHADALRVAQDAELGNAHFDARAVELVEDQPRDAFREVFDETEFFLRKHAADTLDDYAIVDGVRDFPGAEDGVPGQRDLEVELDCLRSDFLVTVQADPGLESQFPYENGVHVGLP